MKVKWCVDWATYEMMRGDEVDAVVELMNFVPKSQGYILDWGGGEGKQSKSMVENDRFRVINIDPSIESLKVSPLGVWCVRGIGQYLPFKEGSFTAIHISAALHHAWKDLTPCLAEIARVSQPGAVIVLCEPLNANPIAWLARKLFTPQNYDPNEKPLDKNRLLKAVSLYFNITTIKYYFLLSYTLPHLIARLPLKPIWRKVAVVTFAIDEFLLVLSCINSSKVVYYGYAR